jgi:outer membrane murein-binding lipoprotein Lpp
MKCLIPQAAVLAGIILTGCSSDDVAMYEKKTVTKTAVNGFDSNHEIVSARQDTVIEVDD